MIRLLVIVAVVGLLVSLVTCSAAAVMAGRSLADGEFLASLDLFGSDGPRLDPGPVEVRDEDWTGADTLEVRIGAGVTLIDRPGPGVRLTGPANVLDDIEFDNGEIRIGQGRRFRSDDGIELTIEADGIHNFELNGAQALTLRDYDEDELHIEMNGATAVEAFGRTQIADIQMNGAGAIEFEGLALESLTIEMNGAGAAHAGPTQLADVEINGMGAVELMGAPARIRQNINGLGTVDIEEGATPPTVETPQRPEMPETPEVTPPDAD